MKGNELEDALRTLDEADADLDRLAEIQARFTDAAIAVGNLLTDALDSIGEVADATLALVRATEQMQETQMSFNLRYLQLQSQMQHENRSFTAISNVMKTKHDTVKNSISNVR
jgi:hypothetical protein